MWLFDTPIYIVLIGIVVGVFVGIAWSASGRKELLYALIGVAVLTVAMLIVERVVITDQEAIQATLAEIARDVQANDMKRVIGHIAIGSPSLVQKAQNEMPNYEFTECRVTKIHKTDLDASAEPRSAIVEFNVRFDGKFKQGGVEVHGPGVRWIRLQMVREEDGKWRVLDYRHEAPHQFLLSEPPEVDP
jgi:low affinity Fe/Cu permease